MKRNVYDKSCYNAVTGMMGHLQTVMNMPVIAGDTVSLNLVGALRLSQLKRYIVLDCHVHIAAYYVKHRWCYSNWETFIKNTLADERSTPTTLATTDITEGTYNTPYNCLGSVPATGNIPDHYVQGYNKIWNNYYRIPNAEEELADSTVYTSFTGAFVRKYGYPVARLPMFWNTGINTTRIDAQDYSTVYTDGVDTTMDLLDIANIQAEYKDQVDREWFAHRYRDILNNKWGSTGISVDMDERPELLGDTSTWLSGVDVNGTDDATLGNYVGKSQGIVQFQMPPRYFNEHGMIWVVMAVRFPPIMMNEKHYLATNTLTADNFLAYPEVVKSTPPMELDEDDFTGNGATASFGIHPAFQYYRTQPNNIHDDFHEKEGYPFVDVDNVNTGTSALYNTMNYEDATNLVASGTRAFFTNVDLGHWNLISKAEIECRSTLPTAAESLYAGARHIN